MRRPGMFLSFFLIFLFLQSSTYADPTITVGFCSSGFEVGIAPTNWGVIYVSIGLYSQEPLSAGECIPDYDPTTQIDRFYIVNSTGAYYLGQYHEYGVGNKTLAMKLKKLRKPVHPVFGQVENNTVIFEIKGGEYAVPVEKILPYLWREEMIKSLVAFSEGNGIVIVPTGIIDVVEDNFTVHREPGPKIGTTLLDLNFTYWMQYRYPLYLNGTMDGNFVWNNPRKEKAIVTWGRLVKTFKKPLYAFYFNGSSIKPIPLMQVQISLKQGGLILAPEYEFINLAPPYPTETSANSSNVIKCSTISSSAENSTAFTSSHPAPVKSHPTTSPNGSGHNKRNGTYWRFLLVAVLGIASIVLVVSKKR